MCKYTVLFLSIFPLLLFSQQETVSTGGQASSNSGNISFTIGQTFTEANSTNGISINEGVQQPYEIYNISSVDKKKEILISVYPNPTNQKIVIDTKEVFGSDMSYLIYDLDGQKIIEDDINAKEMTLDLSKFVSGVYLIEINQNDKLLQTFKIIKN